MHCEQIQIEISSGSILDGPTQEHVKSCASCSEFERFSKEISSKAHQMNIPEMSSNVYENLKQSQRRRPGILASTKILVGLASGTAVFLVAGLMLNGGKAEAAYGRMRAQIAKVKSVHMTIFWRPGNGNVEDGELQKIYELWWRPGAWREQASQREGGDRLQIADGTGGIQFYRYDSASKRVLSSQEANMRPSDFSLETVAKTYMDTPVAFDESSVDANTKLIVAINRGGWSRIKFFVDRTSNLPFKADKEYKTNGTWKVSGHFDFEFNRPIPNSMFEPSDLAPKP